MGGWIPLNILKGYSNYSVKKTEWKAGVNKVGIFQRILQACGVLDWGNGDGQDSRIQTIFRIQNR